MCTVTSHGFTDKCKIRNGEKNRTLYIERLCNNPMVPKSCTMCAAGYDFSSKEEVIIPTKGKVVEKFGLGIEIPEERMPG